MRNINTYYRKYNINLKVFTHEDDVSYYLLGVFMSDGCVQDGSKGGKTCKITSKDYEWLSDIRDQICKQIPLRKKGNCFDMNIYSTQLADWLIGKGCTKNKSLT